MDRPLWTPDYSIKPLPRFPIPKKLLNSWFREEDKPHTLTEREWFGGEGSTAVRNVDGRSVSCITKLLFIAEFLEIKNSMRQKLMKRDQREGTRRKRVTRHSWMARCSVVGSQDLFDRRIRENALEEEHVDSAHAAETQCLASLKRKQPFLPVISALSSWLRLCPEPASHLRDQPAAELSEPSDASSSTYQSWLIISGFCLGTLRDQMSDHDTLDLRRCQDLVLSMTGKSTCIGPLDPKREILTLCGSQQPKSVWTLTLQKSSCFRRRDQHHCGRRALRNTKQYLRPWAAFRKVTCSKLQHWCCSRATPGSTDSARKISRMGTSLCFSTAYRRSVFFDLRTRNDGESPTVEQPSVLCQKTIRALSRCKTTTSFDGRVCSHAFP